MTEINGRIVKGVGGRYSVSTPDGVLDCGIKGIFRLRQMQPAVGDEVTVENGQIVEIKPRRNLLIRPRVANMDQTLMVFSAEGPGIQPDALDRLLLLSEAQNLESVVVINKTDLIDHREPAGAALYRAVGYPVLEVSALDGRGLDELRARLAGKVSVFAGPSGAGKTSLLNRLLPGVDMATGTLSRKTRRGKHTTRHTQLLDLGNGGFVADTPGFTSISMPELAEDVAKPDVAGLFIEFRPFLGACRFADCLHVNEPGCEVKAQAGKAVADARYRRYVEILKEMYP